jgi:dipeptidase E
MLTPTHPQVSQLVNFLQYCHNTNCALANKWRKAHSNGMPSDGGNRGRVVGNDWCTHLRDSNGGQAMLEKENAVKRLLLISSSFHHHGGYLDHAETELKHFLGNTKRVLFVPHAAHDLASYGDTTRLRFADMGYELESVHELKNAGDAVRRAEAIFIGGGNTFRLLDALYRLDLLFLIRERVESGMLYIGSSAGSVVACPSLKTTNDMPIIQPRSFEALGLVRFQINPHYTDPDPSSTYRAETRDGRLLEFLEENDSRIIALREGAMLLVQGGAIALRGITGARIFSRGIPPLDILPGEQLDMVRP